MVMLPNRRSILARYRRAPVVLGLALVVSMGVVGTVSATQTSTSTHYSVTETQFGGGSVQHQCSTNYCSKSTAGDTAVGDSSSTSYSARFGSNTSDVPTLQVIVTGGTQDVGVLDDSHTGTAVSTIGVRTYLSNGYVIQITGGAPNQGTHALDAIWPVASTSQQGAEQFGINLVANTAPAIGANPVDQPSGASNTGVVGANYSNPNSFAYHDSDIVVTNPVGNGETDYTLSMIINVSKVTPGGQYTGVYSAVVVPVY